MISLLISLLIGPPLPVDGRDGLIILKEPQNVQLPPGADPGSFHFVRKNVKVTFSMKPDFPVRLVAEDYAHLDVTSKLINSGAPFGFEIDLPPGTYTIRTKAHEKSDAPYWDSTGFQIHIDKGGMVHYAEPPEFSREFRHSRKIEIISPKNMEVLSGKTVYLGWHPPKVLDPDWKRLIPDTVVRWKPLPGVQHYMVELWPLDDPFHSESYGDGPQRYEIAGSKFCFPRDEWLRFGEADRLSISDVDPYGNYGDAGSSGVVIMTPGAEEYAKAHPSDSFPGDEWIDARTEVRFAQGLCFADDFPHVEIGALGNGPALNAGMQPDERLSSVNGTKISDLDQLRSALAKIPAGANFTLGICYPTARRFTLRLP
jgi:hypothetical protein